MKFWREYFTEFWIKPAKNPWHWVMVLIGAYIISKILNWGAE